MAERAPASGRRGLERIASRVHPGSRLTSVRRLRGGIDARVHSLTLELAGGGRATVVLRRGGSGNEGAMRRHYRTLEVLEGAGVPAPRPLLLDIAGEYCAEPALVMSYEGRPNANPRREAAWLQDMAAALAQIHRLTPAVADLSHLEAGDRAAFDAAVSRPLPPALEDDQLAVAVRARLINGLPALGLRDPRLVHRDFWPGNTVWRRGRLSAVVDWATAQVGDPRGDVAQCRVDLTLMRSREAANAFLHSYAEASGVPPESQWFFDLHCGLRALPVLEGYLRGYHDLGLTQLTLPEIEGRLRGFASETLALTR